MRLLFLDIETSPTLSYHYNRYDVNISPDQVVHTGGIMCYQAAWDDGPVFVGSIRKKRALKPNDDKELCEQLVKLINQADVVVAHNADRFDLAKISARLAVHDLKPFIPPQVIDTLKICRRFFKFEANSLDSVCHELGLGRKFHSGGFETSLACMRGDQAAWDKLLKYGKQDVLLLRKLYYRLRPWMKNHPNHNLYSYAEKPLCHACGSAKIVWNGQRRTLTQIYNRYQCRDCGSNGMGKKSIVPKSKKLSITRGI